MNNQEKFWNASIEDMKRGYFEEDEHFECLLCEKKIEKGIIYQETGIFFEAEKYMQIHIKNSHNSVFEHLISLDKKITGLSDHQNGLIRLFYKGKTDAEIQKEMGIGSSSTIRNHRFVLKEKERQAKIFLVLMELLKATDKKSAALISKDKTTKRLDDRFNISAEEKEGVLKKYFPKGVDGPLKTFNMKEKSKLVVLRQIIKRFDINRIYTEKEVNEILNNAYEDFATIRRYLIEYGFMERKSDGSQYWIKEVTNKREELDMDRKKELLQQYKEMKKDAGVYQIKNIKNQKVMVVVTPDLKTMNGKRFELNMGGHKNIQLQDEWKVFGEDAFEFEVLEVLEEKEEGFFDKKEELKKLEKKWLEKIQPYGEQGYNKEKK